MTVKVVGSGEDPLRALSLAKRLREEAARQGEPYDWVCLLLDVDDHATLPRCLIEAKRSGVHVVVSNPQFELWLVWHIADHTAWVEGKKISRRASGLKLVEGKHLDAKFPIHGYEDAVVRARQADQGMADARQGPNPSSSMPLLVALMQGGAP